MKEKWFKISDKIRFLLVGCFNAGVSYLMFSIICLSIGEDKYQLALALSWILSSVVSFSTQKFLVFVGGKKWFIEYFKCCITWFFSYLINAGLLSLFVSTFHNVYISQIFAVGFAAIFTYIVFKIFAFKKHN